MTKRSDLRERCGALHQHYLAKGGRKAVRGRFDVLEAMKRCGRGAPANGQIRSPLYRKHPLFGAFRVSPIYTPISEKLDRQAQNDPMDGMPTVDISVISFCYA